MRMKKILKVLLTIVVVALIAGAGFAGFVSIRGIPTYTVSIPEIPDVEVTPERVARGAKMSAMLCQHCHLDPATNAMTGVYMVEIPEFGTINAKNITNDPEYGIGKWTDAEIIYLLRTGIHPHTGAFVPPYMPKLVHMADEDINAIVAYLRSDMPEVQAVKSELPPSSPSFLTKFLCLVAFKPFDFPSQPIPLPDTTNQLEWGKYITLYQLECYACHSRSFETMNMLKPELSEGFFGGGNPIGTADGSRIMSRNITPDEETGIGTWTEEQFLKAVKYGIHPNGPALRPPMVPYVQLTDDEVRAIFAYMKTVPPIKNKVDRGI
jgi:cytochrome c2